MLRPIETLKLTLQDGNEYAFLLSAGGVKRLKEKLKVETIQEILNRDAIDCGIPVLWEALLNKPDGWTEQNLADQLPADLEGLTRSVFKLLGFSFPDPNNRPTGGDPPKAEPPTIQ